MPIFKSPKVSIVTATETDPLRAAALLIFTKSTRLEMTPGGYDQILERVQADEAWMRQELDYMSKTIRSSWEFLDVVFMVENVSRACAQQITRTRHASFAMQSQRVTNMQNASFSWPSAYEDPELNPMFADVLDDAMVGYKRLVDAGMKLEDARGVLPMNIQCNLVEKYNFRTLASLIPARSSYRAQGEYREVARQMKEQLIAMWPWAELFFRPANATANSLLDEIVFKLDELPGAMESEAAMASLHHELLSMVAKIRDLFNKE